MVMIVLQLQNDDGVKYQKSHNLNEDQAQYCQAQGFWSLDMARPMTVPAFFFKLWSQ